MSTKNEIMQLIQLDIINNKQFNLKGTEVYCILPLVPLRPLTATCYALIFSMERLKIHGTSLLIPPAKVLANIPAPNLNYFSLSAFTLVCGSSLSAQGELKITS